MAVAICDYYSEDNYSGVGLAIGTEYVSARAQSFEGDGGVLVSAKAYLRKAGSPTGNAVAQIYAHSGTYGSGIPTGSVLATSESVDVSTISTSRELVQFTFSGAEQIDLVDGTHYFFVIFYDADDNSRYIVWEADSSGTHEGNSAAYNQTNWVTLTYDLCFYIYREAPLIGGKYPLPAFSV
jgi:hypothetical protein